MGCLGVAGDRVEPIGRVVPVALFRVEAVGVALRVAVDVLEPSGDLCRVERPGRFRPVMASDSHQLTQAHAEGQRPALARDRG
jgi:hypothetical protein